MAHLQRISQKHSASWSRKILTPSKVKSLLTKPGKRHQVFHRQWVPLSIFFTSHAPLGTLTSTSPMDIVAIDFLKVDRVAGGYEYILVIIDQFTWYALAYATTTKSAKTAACWKTFQWFSVEIRNAKSNPTRSRERIRKQNVWWIRKVFWN